MCRHRKSGGLQRFRVDSGVRGTRQERKKWDTGDYKELKKIFSRCQNWKLDNGITTLGPKLACWPTMSLTHVALWVKPHKPGSSQHQAMPALHTADPPFLSSFGRPVALAPYLRSALHRKGQAATSKRGSGQVHIMGRWSINLLVTRCFPTVQFAQNRMLSRSLDCTSSGPSFTENPPVVNHVVHVITQNLSQADGRKKMK